MFLKHNRYGLLWALLIMALCGIPGSDLPHSTFLELLQFDKLVHAGVFFVLVILLTHGFKRQETSTVLRSNPVSTALIICIAYGGLLELLQDAVFKERSADIYDFIANSFGCVAGAMLYSKVERSVLQKLKFLR